jgi:uncharacterized membrane protein YhfC
MKTEMDVLGMDERQRLAWLRANRATLFAIAVAWLGMIGWDLVQQRIPVFLIIMIPVFALVRLVSYLYYSRLSRSGP